ncbi:hypothetical protein Tco_0099359 [Tanacetum coccineum]
MSESTKRHEENSNLIKEIRASTDAAIRNQGASIKTLEIQIGQMSKVLQERGFGSLPSSTEANPRDQVKSISTTIEADSYPIRRIRSSQYAVSTGQNHTLMYETRQTTIPFLKSWNGASVSDMPLSTYLNLGLGELADRTMKYPKGIAENVLVGFEFTHANFFPLLYVNVISKKFRNSIMKEKMVYKGNNVIGALMNVPIFVGTFSVVTDFVVIENMDAYRDEGMGDVILGEPFLREVGIKTKRFEEIITIYNGDDEVSEKDEMNGVSHAYQKLKGFYKGVLKLGPDYIRDAKTEEWLTRWHISVHEME